MESRITQLGIPPTPVIFVEGHMIDGPAGATHGAVAAAGAGVGPGLGRHATVNGEVVPGANLHTLEAIDTKALVPLNLKHLFVQSEIILKF